MFQLARHYDSEHPIATKAMSELQFFEVVGDHAEYRPTGQASLKQMVEMVETAIVFAREQSVRRLLVVTSGLTGFNSPSIGDRYFFLRDWGEAARAFVRVAIVPTPEMIDPRKFGVTVAANAGFDSNVFASEVDALAWLLRN
jgi:hypothetical protein